MRTNLAKTRTPIKIALSLSLALSLSPYALPSAWASEETIEGSASTEDAQIAPDGIQTENGIQFAINTSGTVTVVGLENKNVENLVIPATLGGVPVTAIDQNAFRDNSSLKTVVLPEGIEVIGDYAFYACTDLVNITLPSSLKTIGERAFFLVCQPPIYRASRQP